MMVVILLSAGDGGGGDVGGGESQVPKASLPSRITSSFVRHIPGRRKYDSRAARKIFTFFRLNVHSKGIISDICQGIRAMSVENVAFYIS